MAVQNPNITVTYRPAQTALGIGDISILYIGQKTSGGTATANAITENVISVPESNDYFGRTSHLAGILRTAFDDVYKFTGGYRPIVDCIALDDNGSTKADGTLSCSGTATTTGSYEINVNGDTYTISVASGDTANAVGTAIETAITNNADAEYTASNTTGTVTITAVNAGTVGNNILTIVKGTVAGLTLTADQVYLTGGATDPVITSLFDVVTNANKKYNFIVFPSTYTTSVLLDYTETAPNRKTIGFQTKVDTYANLNSYLDGLDNTFEKIHCVFRNVLNSSGKPQIKFNADHISSYVVSIIGTYLTPNSNISKFGISEGDTRGGYFWAGLPFHNTNLEKFGAIDTDTKISVAQENELTSSCGVGFIPNGNDTGVVLNKVVSTYKQDSLGNSDDTYDTLNKYLLSVLSVQYFVNNLLQKYKRYALTDSTAELPSGVAMANKDSIIGALIGYYKTLSDGNGSYRFLRTGNSIDTFIEGLESSYSEDLSTGTVNFGAVIFSIVAQLRRINLDIVINTN